MNEDTHVEWREWGPEAFAEADRTNKPVLLSLSATWCAGCHEMDTETYSEPRIAANVNDGFVPIRVDVDRQPRVRERYNMGGFPTTAFLTPDGKLLTGAMYLGPDGMRQVLDRVREMWDAKGKEAGRVPRALAGNPTPAGAVTPAIEEHLAGQLSEKYDERFAGWGTDAKFPMPRTVEFALKRERDQALRTLDAVRDHLLDDVAGGFFRYAGDRGWGDVHHEKLLDTNAALVRAFANAYLYTGEEVYREPAEQTIDYLTDELWTGLGIGGSQGPAEGSDYYLLDADERAETRKPRTDLTVFAGGNALAADAFLTYHAYTDDETAREYARRLLDTLRTDLVALGESEERGHGVVTHFAGDEASESLLLEDHARVVAAFCRAQQVLGEGVDVARAVADAAIDELYDEESFRDGPAEGTGMLDKPLRPIDANVEMADALLDLAVLTGDDEYREIARETIGAFAGAADRIGVQVASYGAVAGRLCRDPLVVAVADDVGSDLHRAALRIADHEKLVVPDATGDEYERGNAYLLDGDEAYAAETPNELMETVADRAQL